MTQFFVDAGNVYMNEVGEVSDSMTFCMHK